MPSDLQLVMMRKFAIIFVVLAATFFDTSQALAIDPRLVDDALDEWLQEQMAQDVPTRPETTVYSIAIIYS